MNEIPKTFELGLKGNWRAFKEFVETQLEHRYREYYFVYEEDDCGDEVKVFTSHSDLDEWLENVFWEHELYDTYNLEDSMNDFKVWKLISESDFTSYSGLYRGAKETSIVIKGERYYRKLIPVCVEPTVNVSTNFY